RQSGRAVRGRRSTQYAVLSTEYTILSTRSQLSVLDTRYCVLRTAYCVLGTEYGPFIRRVEQEREAMITQPTARQGRTLVLVLAALLLLAGALGAYLWWPSGPAAPPEIPLDGVEPDVARAVRLARAAVVKEPRSAASWGL